MDIDIYGSDELRRERKNPMTTTTLVLPLGTTCEGTPVGSSGWPPISTYDTSFWVYGTTALIVGRTTLQSGVTV